MPVINGIKMACDACIRGHRSTKCDHGDSRVLMKVRKPGRPLTACPHLQSQHCDCPKNKGCGCSSSITVAFPRKQACGDCKTGPKANVKTEGKPAAPAIPDVPASTAGTFKVKKTSHLTAQIPRARPQSYDGSFFDGVDLNSVNIMGGVRPPSLASANGIGMNGVVSPPLPISIAPAFPNLYPHNLQQLPLYARMSNGQTPRNSIANGSGMPRCTPDSEAMGFYLSDPSMANGSVNYASGGTDIVNGHAQQPILAAPYALSSDLSYTSLASGTTPAPTTKSCCSSKTSLESSPNGFTMNNASNAPDHRSYITPAYSNGNSPVYNPMVQQQTTTTYTYPGSFSTPQAQMPTGQWGEDFSMNYPHQHPPLQQLQTMQNSTGVLQLPQSAIDDNMPQNCGCGTDCHCLGCESHPYNDETQAYIRATYHQMNSQQKRESASPVTPIYDQFYTLQNQPTPNMFPMQAMQQFYDDNSEKDPIITTTCMKSETPDSLSRTDSPQLSLNGGMLVDTPAGNQQQELDANNYYIVDYQLGGDCSGDKSVCLCGDDCQCFGCTIHNVSGEARQLSQDEEGLKIEDGTIAPEEVPVKKSCCG